MQMKRTLIGMVFLLLLLWPEWARDIHFLFFHHAHLVEKAVGVEWQSAGQTKDCPYLYLEYFPVSAIQKQVFQVWLLAFEAGYPVVKVCSKGANVHPYFSIRAPPKWVLFC